ncbi:hypothetical protein [Pedobacter cryophilus]|uniref:Uncharacterized protein n=1 Tax=Pedobacter cryophilus TaxID=2571271 RepID=A0A4U1BWY6_9SPHI|nr:hypothetical protein [Pedobacter cryophilus]TKB96841.1 hypothetical protein FA046_12235 [Pedobacter cryophilus]
MILVLNMAIGIFWFSTKQSNKEAETWKKLYTDCEKENKDFVNTLLIKNKIIDAIINPTPVVTDSTQAQNLKKQ